jgi:hypothetical protein
LQIAWHTVVIGKFSTFSYENFLSLCCACVSRASCNLLITILIVVKRDEMKRFCSSASFRELPVVQDFSREKNDGSSVIFLFHFFFFFFILFIQIWDM